MQNDYLSFLIILILITTSGSLYEARWGGDQIIIFIFVVGQLEPLEGKQIT